MNIAPHHFRYAALINPAKCGGLMLKKPTFFYQKANVGGHFRGDGGRRSPFHLHRPFCQMRRNRIDLESAECEIPRVVTQISRGSVAVVRNQPETRQRLGFFVARILIKRKPESANKAI